MEEKLDQAVTNGDVELVNKLLVECKSNYIYISCKGKLLATAASKGFTEICKVLLESQNVLYSDEESSNALEAAIESGNLETLDVLLQKRVGVYSFAKNGKSLFGFVLEKKWMEAVKLLLRRGIKPSWEDSSELANFAVASKDTELYKLLEEQTSMYVDKKDEHGLTPLDRAVENQDIEAVRVLCKFKPTIAYEFLSRNFTKLKGEEMTELILEKSNGMADMTCIICNAIGCENYEFIKWYCEIIKNRDKIYQAVVLSLSKAIDMGFVDIAMLLIHQNPDKFYKIAYIWAVSGGQEEIVRRLLEQGYTPDIYYVETGMTALEMAISKKNWNIAKLLIQSGANVAIRDVEGDTALHFAASLENCEIIELLLDHGAKIDVTNVKGYSVLHCAVLSEKENEEVFELLLRCGADVNVENEMGRTPLISAIANNKTVASKFLIKTIVEMKLDGQCVSDKNWEASETDVELNGYQVECEKEMKNLMDSKFVSSSLSYYSIKKIKDSDQLAALASNKNIFEVLKSSEFEREYSIYGKAIVEHFEKGVVRKRGLDRLNAMFLYVACRATDVLPKLPLTCIHQIFSYLSDKDAASLMLL